MAVAIVTGAQGKSPATGPGAIDWLNPITQGLIYAAGDSFAPPGASSGSSFYSRTNGLLSNVAQSLGTQHGYFAADVPGVVGSPFGPALNFDGTRKAYTQSITGVANGLATDESCVVVCTFGSSTGSQHLFGFATIFSSSLADYGRGVGVEGGNLFAWGASALNGKKLTATLPPLNTPCVIAVRFAVDGAVYVNGQKVASGDMSHSYGYYLSTGCAVAAGESNELANFTGLVGPRRWWRRGLRDNELQALSVNPQLIYRQQPRVSFPTIGGGATSGVGASAGTGAASATAQATWAAVGASAGAGAASATGTDANGGISSATAASSGAGAASATSQATWAAVGASAGAGTGAATSQTVAASIGASASAGTGAATSQTVAASIGASAGTGAAAAIGDDANSAFSSATAASSGTGAAAATSRATWATVAASITTTGVAATANAVWAGVGASTGTATASADGVTGSAVQAAAGTATASSTAGAVAQVVVAAVGTVAAVAVAGGVSNAISAVVEVVGAAVAVAVASAVTQAIWNAVGASTGTAAAAGASPVTLDAAAVARQIVVRTMEAVVVVTSRGLASKVVTDG